MSNPLLSLIKKYTGADALPRARQAVVGLAQDFWKDGRDNPLLFTTNFKFKKFATSSSTLKEIKAGSNLPQKNMLWQARPGEISEKMWGDGSVVPAGESVTEMLIGALELAKEMSILDLSAGLGGRTREMVEKYGVHITSLEPDLGIANRALETFAPSTKGQHDTIAHYTADSFSTDRTYNCIIARETFYRTANRESFIAALGACAKPEAQISFTDYIVNPEDRENPAITAWRLYEQNVAPFGLVEMAQAWGKVGFSLSVHEDQTDFYKSEVQQGLKRFAKFLATSAKPDTETKKAIISCVQTWAHRVAAMEQGMKFIRFYGARK